MEDKFARLIADGREPTPADIDLYRRLTGSRGISDARFNPHLQRDKSGETNV